MAKTIGLALALAIAATATAYAETVKLGLDPWLGYGPLWIADRNGYFEEYGVDVELQIIRLDDDIRAAVQDGDIDVAASPTNGLILDVNRGIKLKGFLVLDTSLDADGILTRADDTSITGLAGKTIAYEPGTTSDLLLGYALRANGMSLTDVEPVPTPASEAGSALIAGKVDAAVTYEPYLSAALAESSDIAIIYTAAQRPGLISDMLTAKPAWIDAHSSAVQGLIRAWNDAVNFVRERPNDGLAIISDAIGSPIDEIKPAFDGLQLYTVEENMEFLDGAFQATISQIGEIMQEVHPAEIEAVPSPDNLLSLEDLLAVAR